MKPNARITTAATILTVIETAIERTIDPYIRAAIRETLRGFTVRKDTIDDIAQYAKKGMFKIIRDGSQSPGKWA